MERLQIRAQRRNALPGHMLHHVAPMRTDIGESAGTAIRAGIDAPVPVRVVQEPVLRVGALNSVNLAQFARFPQTPHLLHHRVIAQVMERAIRQVFLLGFRDQLLRFRNGGRQRLFAKHGFACFERSHCHGEVKRIRRADVHGIELGVRQQRAVVASRPWDAHFIGELARLLFAGSGNRDNLYVPQPPDSLRVDAAHEASAEDGRSQLFHRLQCIAQLVDW